MQRRFPTEPEQAVETFRRLLVAQEGLEALRRQLPPGATLADARRLHRRLRQESRKPSALLDGELGIVRG
jgi:hypothetical protein